ncbi:MAG: CBM35 domain-containing protein, partial [Armatimonadia bacterium]
QIAWGDFLGDWREEIITSVPGELRVYTTTIPATDRRTCLLQDPIYRIDAAHLTMGYIKPPTPGAFLAQLSPALWVSAPQSTIKHGQPLTAKVVLAASAGEPVHGAVRLEAPAGLTVTPASVPLDVPAGRTGEATFQIALKDKPAPLTARAAYNIRAVMEGALPLESRLSLKVEDEPLQDALVVQAERFTGQGGGEVMLREDKVGAVGKAFSHWDAKGHWLSWQVTVPEAGKYLLVLRYCTPLTAQREVQVDATAPFVALFPGTGGFGSATANEWAHYVVHTPDQKWLTLDLSAGTHTIKLTNADGRGMNLDYLALYPVR